MSTFSMYREEHIYFYNTPDAVRPLSTSINVAIVSRKTSGLPLLLNGVNGHVFWLELDVSGLPLFLDDVVEHAFWLGEHGCSVICCRLLLMARARITSATE